MGEVDRMGSVKVEEVGDSCWQLHQNDASSCPNSLTCCVALTNALRSPLTHSGSPSIPQASGFPETRRVGSSAGGVREYSHNKLNPYLPQVSGYGVVAYLFRWLLKK